MLRLVEVLPSFGWTVHVLVPKNTRGFKNPRIEHIEQPWGTLHILHRSFLRWSTAWMNRRADEVIEGLIQAEQIQYIHVHHLNGLPLQWLTQLSNVYLHITLHDYAIPCARGQLLNRHHSICHGPSTESCQQCIEPWLTLESDSNILYNRMIVTQRIMSAAQKIDAPSRDLIQRMSNLYPTIHIEHCPLPTTESNIQSIRDTSCHQLMFVGSIHPSKGLHILLQSMHRLRHTPYHLKIVGGITHSDLDPKYASTWLTLAENLPNVSYLGEKSHDALLCEMGSTHCLILPSIWPENSPLVIREALQHGLHVICGHGGSVELSDSITQIRPLSVYNLSQAILNLSPIRPDYHIYPNPKQIIQQWIQPS